MPDKKLTNYDRIRNMSVEEMAEFMYENNENCETFCALTRNGKCNSFEGKKQTCGGYHWRYATKEEAEEKLKELNK